MEFSNRFVKTLLLISALTLFSVDCGGKGGLMGLMKKGGLMMLGGRYLPMPMPFPIPIPMVHDNHHHMPCPPKHITFSESIGGLHGMGFK